MVCGRDADVLPIEVRVFVTVPLQASPQIEQNQAGDSWYRYTEWNETHLELCALFFFLSQHQYYLQVHKVVNLNLD